METGIECPQGGFVTNGRTPKLNDITKGDSQTWKVPPDTVVVDLSWDTFYRCFLNTCKPGTSGNPHFSSLQIAVVFSVAPIPFAFPVLDSLAQAVRASFLTAKQQHPALRAA